jgi:Kef-type K+ transport system membrane component KefB
VNQVGIILGPSLLGRLRIFSIVLFSINSQEIIGMLSVLSYALFSFVTGVKMDIGMIKRTGRKAWITGVACMLLPLLINLLVQTKFRREWLKDEEVYMIPFLTVAHCVTPFVVLACLLEDLKILNSELGRLGLSAALVSDILSISITIGGNLFKISQEQGSMLAAIDFGAVITYVIVIVFAIRPAMFWVIRQTPEGRPVKDTYIHTIMLMVLGSGYLSHLFGQTLLFGPLILGLAVPDGPPLGSTIVKKFSCLISDVFLPLFVTTCGMRTNLSLIVFDNRFMALNGILIVSNFVAKVVACLVPFLYSKMPLNDALALALLLSCKGVIQLFYYSYLQDTKVTIYFFSPPLFYSFIENEITFSFLFFFLFFFFFSFFGWVSQLYVI